MSEMGFTRRKFCQLAGTGLLAASPLARAQGHSGSTLTAREVVARIKKNVGVPWHTPTADEFKIGDPDAPITGITTTFMSTLDLLERSAADVNNFVITHEPTFWSAADVVSDVRDDPLYDYKVNFIEKNKMVVWRFHDHWHAHHPADGIFTGWNKAMGWESYASPGANPFSHEYVIPETSFGDLAWDMHKKLDVRSMRHVGDPKLKVTRVGHAGHYIQQCMQVLPRVDALIVFECREWEAAEYVRDAIAAGQKKALIQLPHEGGEEAGMHECARWLKTLVTEVPIKFIPSGDPFWMRLELTKISKRGAKVRKRRSAQVVLTTVIAAVLSLPLWAEAPMSDHWVSAWSAAPHAPLPFPGLPPTPVFENQTIRMVVRLTIGGNRVRIRLSNAFGTTALKIGAAHIALATKTGVLSGSDYALTFGGNGVVSIPPGAPVLSDPVDLKVLPFSEVAVSVFLPEKTTASTVHFWGQHETSISEAGDFTARAEIPNTTTKSAWYWLCDIEVWAPEETAATVAFGDSITDGVGAKQGDYADWPDVLAKRLGEEKGTPAWAVVNEGIGGNRVLYDGAGVSALARFDRDVLAQPGVANLIILESINDIGWPHMKPPPMPNGEKPPELPFVHQTVNAQELIVGMRQLIDRAHQHGIRVFGATLTPYEGAGYYSEDGEATRQEVNRWIRTSGTFDGVFDFDAAVRDPNHPGRFIEKFDSGDHLHPSADGFKAMADAVDLAVLTGRKGSRSR